MMGRRHTAAVLVATALVAGCAGPVTGTTSAASPAATATASVERRDLVTRDELNGMLGYRGAVPLIAGRDGTLTWMPRTGTVVRRGDVVAEIDGTATRLLLGDRPVWRHLAVGCRGPDVRQLNDNLAALGYAERDELPGARFDWRTWHALARWQEDVGARRTGAVALGDVLFLPHGVRVGTVEAPLGTRVSAGQTIANATRRTQAVTVDLDAARRDALTKGSPVVVILPDRTRIDAAVRSTGRVVSPPSGSQERPTVDVEIELSGATSGPAGELDAAPVVVVVEHLLAEDVLTVPVGALVAVTGGGYTVERVTAAGTEQVPVEPGQFADGLVEITGAVADGDRVAVPS